MAKIVLIIDKSQPYLSYQQDLTLEEWEPEEIRKVENFSEVGEATIFGNPPTATLHLNDLNAVKKLVKDFENAEKANVIESKLSEGLIITTPVARVSTKKLEAFVNKLGGKVIFAKENSKDKTSVTDKLLSDTNLPHNVKKFLSDYIGDDYETLLSLLRSVMTLPNNIQNKLTVEDMFIRLPQPPGSVAPWEIEKPLMKGNLQETISLYRRITNHSHFLVILSLLKNKIQLSWKISTLLEDNPRITLAAASEALKIANNYPFKLAYESAKKLGFDSLTDCLKTLADAEMKVKGGSNANPDVIMEIALSKIVERIRR